MSRESQEDTDETYYLEEVLGIGGAPEGWDEVADTD